MGWEGSEFYGGVATEHGRLYIDPLTAIFVRHARVSTISWTESNQSVTKYICYMHYRRWSLTLHSPGLWLHHCVTDHLSSNNLLKPHQSAYCKHHSTEIALLYIHDHLIYAIGPQKLSCLLDLSAAFDTIDHDILITRLSSWFGIHGSILNWFKSYLSSRTFRIKCDNYFSSSCACLCGAPTALSLVHYCSLCTHLSIPLFHLFC